MKKSLICFLSILFAVGPYSLAQAKVTGMCSNCHTMHNSQGGAPMAYEFSGASFTSTETPNEMLLITDCLGCHTAIDGSTWKDSITGAPIVYNTSTPNYGASSDGGITYQGLAAGNFYWVTQDNANGHNIFSGNPDGTLTVAPGAVTTSCGVESCHNNLHATSTSHNNRQGCSKCHMMGGPPAEFGPSPGTDPKGYHHADDSNTVVGSETDDQDGYYRFLSGHQGGAGHGVSGIEDDDWQWETTTTHNEYLGNSATKTSAGSFSACGNIMTGFCCGCHGNFHIEESSGSWIRHPSDAVIQNSGEYANAFGAAGSGTGTYDPLIPVARPSLSSVSSIVNIGTDLVMCLSCHRAHASPYYKMMRWDYKSWPGGGTDGCGTCHTSKD